MSFSEIFGGFSGITGNGFDARAMTPDELRAYEQKTFLGAMQAKFSDQYWRGLSNWNPVPERPLDERFVDFKLRLEAAVNKRNAQR